MQFENVQLCELIPHNSYSFQSGRKSMLQFMYFFKKIFLISFLCHGKSVMLSRMLNSKGISSDCGCIFSNVERLWCTLDFLKISLVHEFTNSYQCYLYSVVCSFLPHLGYRSDSYVSSNWVLKCLECWLLGSVAWQSKNDSLWHLMLSDLLWMYTLKLIFQCMFWWGKTYCIL